MTESTETRLGGRSGLLPDDPVASAPLALQCMEVWGGNQRTFRKVEMHGLDVWVSADPLHRDGGGDVHYLSSCGTGRIIRLLVADVSGHGEQVAQTANELATLMRRHVNTLDQNRFVRGLNAEFRTLIERGQFATAVAATFFAPTRGLEVTIAGHPRPLTYRGSTGRWSPLDGPEIPSGTLANIPLGILESVRYYSHASQLEPDDVVLFFSDAVNEAKPPGGEPIGEDGLLELVAQLDPRDPDVFLKRLVTGLERWRQGPLDDDETILLFRPNGLEADMSLKGRARAIGTLLRGIARAIRHGEPLPIPGPELPNLGGMLIPALGQRRRSRESRRGR